MIHLVIATALNVMFCWYTAYISILFFCIFVLVEFVDYVAEESFSWKLMLDRALRFAGAIALGLLLSAWTFFADHPCHVQGRSRSSTRPPT